MQRQGSLEKAAAVQRRAAASMPQQQQLLPAVVRQQAALQSCLMMHRATSRRLKNCMGQTMHLMESQRPMTHSCKKSRASSGQQQVLTTQKRWWVVASAAATAVCSSQSSPAGNGSMNSYWLAGKLADCSCSSSASEFAAATANMHMLRRGLLLQPAQSAPCHCWYASLLPRPGAVKPPLTNASAAVLQAHGSSKLPHSPASPSARCLLITCNTLTETNCPAGGHC